MSKYGYTALDGVAKEVERSFRTSTIEIVPSKRTVLAESMFVLLASYEVAQSRQFRYFLILDDKVLPNGRWTYICGFTNKDKPDLKTEFGDQYTYENESGQKRMYFSVMQMTHLIEKGRKLPTAK